MDSLANGVFPRRENLIRTMCLISPPAATGGGVFGEIRHKVQIPLCRHRLR